MKIDTQEAVLDMQAEAVRIVEEAGMNPGEDEYVVVKKFGKDQAIILEVTVNDEEKRVCKMHVTDSFFIAEESKNTLDIYNQK